MKQATRSFPQTTDPNVDGLLGIYKGVSLKGEAYRNLQQEEVVG